MAGTPLPIDALLPELGRALAESRSAVLRAPPGAGKTTRVPPALLDLLRDGERVVVLEPRRIAARAAAQRVASERGGPVGEEVGFHVRFDRRAGPRTRLLYVTFGVFLRTLQADPFLEGIGAVVLDEFHERSLEADLALAMTRRVQSQGREDLRIVVMSATLDPRPVAEFLGGAPVLESAGFLHPVEVRYAAQPDRRRATDRAAEAVRAVLAGRAGDVLVFLPGVGEIRGTRDLLLERGLPGDVRLVELYGDLPPERQDEALRSIPGARRVVLSTNVAESSVTVEGVTAVVDTGLARSLRHDPSAGLGRLVLHPVSRASADQRAGRAGRVGPGLCVRLWTEREHRALPADTEPEIRRVDLAGAVLELAAWGEPDLARFPWLEAPEATRLEAALGLLHRLGALREGRITEAGRAMARLPVHPRLGRMLLEGHSLGHPRAAAAAAAVLSERGRRTGATGRGSESDLLDRADAVERGGAPRTVIQVRDQLDSLLRETLGPAPRPSCGAPEAVLRCALAAYPDRLARRRERGSRRAVMAGGGGVRLDEESSVLEAELFVCIDVDAGPRGKRAEARVRAASAVRRDWLPAERLRTEVDVELVGDRVAAYRRTRYEDLVLDEVPVPVPDDGRAAALVAAAADRDLARALPLDDPAVRGFLDRVRWLREVRPELGLPAFDEPDLRALLPELAAGARSVAELRRSPLLDRLRSALTHDQFRALEREAPERLRVPSGSLLPLTYEPGRPPVLAVRIQEVFGWRETPRLGGGRARVLLHLLAPNHRPQQVTDDLESFWAGTYAQVRKELRRRYPRHAWPEDPATAEPERRPRPR